MKQAEEFGFSAVLAIFILGMTNLSSLATSGDEFWDSNFGVPGAFGGIYNSGCGTAVIFQNNLYINGDFDFIGGNNISRLAKWDGTNWSPVGSGVNGSVLALAASEKALYAAGSFTMAGGMPITNFAKWDGTNWFPLDNKLAGQIGVLVADQDILYTTGRLNWGGATNEIRLAKWDGTNWTFLGPITNYNPYCTSCGDQGVVAALALKGHELYVGGYFIYAGNVFANNIAKWDGTNWSALAAGAASSVLSIVIISNNLYAAGAFYTAGGVTVNCIARWDGTNWYSLGGGTSDYLSVSKLAANGTDLYAAGPFEKIGGVNTRQIAKWDGNKWSALGSGLGENYTDTGIRSMIANGSELFISGYFTAAGGKPSTNIALYHIPHPLRTARTNNTLTLSWPATGTNFFLESCSSLPSTNWTLVPQTPAVLGRELVVTQEICLANKFYRLRRR